MDVQDLIDRAEILDCMHRYAPGMDRLDRRDGRWGITVRRCLVEWATNPPSLLPVEGAGAGGIVARDRSDASYQRPLVID